MALASVHVLAHGRCRQMRGNFSCAPRYSYSCLGSQGAKWKKHLTDREMEQLDLIWHELPEAG